MAPDNPFLPLLIDMTGRKIVIFGGGSVGERKTLLFSRYADVTVISRHFSPTILDLSGKDNVHLVTADAGKLSDSDIDDFIDGAFLVIPATNQRAINEKISSLAKEKNILTNQVDAIGDITVPSVIKRGDLTISISTSGSSPAFSRFVRQKVESVITPDFEGMIKIQENLRAYLKENVPDQRDRKELLWEVLESEDVWSALGESYDKGFNIAQGIVTEKINEKVR